MVPAAGIPKTSSSAPSRLGFLVLLPLSLFLFSSWSLLNEDGALRIVLPWVPSLGVDLTLHVDGLALQMILLITGVGSCVFVYAAGYMATDPRRLRFFVLLTLFMIAMLGAVSTDNLISLFAFWEMTSVTSFLLVGFKHEHESSRKSALQALLVTASGGLALLAGVTLLGQIAGTYSIQQLLATHDSWQGHPLEEAALLGVLVGAFTKSAQFPFHFWLPNAMAAPTPASAYLHSATMVKLGIYLLARLDGAFDTTPFWEFLLISCGGLTSAWAVLQTLRERDLKRILAWSTVSALGTMTMLIGLPGGDSATAVAALILAHALYKAPLFFVAGNVDISAGTRNIDHLAGLARRMPWTAGAALLAAFSMSGFPTSLGYFAKELANIAKREGEVYSWVGYAGILVSAFSVAIAAIAAIRVFWHRGGARLPKQLVEVGWAMRLPPCIIALVGIAFGINPRLADAIIGESVEAMHPSFDFLPASSAVSTESGWTPMLVALCLGSVVFLLWDRIHRALKPLSLSPWLRLADWYERLLALLPVLAKASTTMLQPGRLGFYTQMFFAFVVLGLGAGLGLLSYAGASPSAEAFALTQTGTASSLAVFGALALLTSAALTACVVRDSFLLLLASGLMGLACAIVFLFLGAPDLAFTQFSVEVAFVVIIASTLLRVRHLDLSPPVETPRILRAALSIGLGAMVTILSLVALGSESFDPALTRYFSERSVPDAHGRNVVNVILVDFRAIDTLGEVSAVFVSFLAAIPLLKVLQARRGQAG